MLQTGAVQNQEGKQCCLVVLVSAAGCSEVARAALVSRPAGTVDLLVHPIPLRKNLLSQVKGSIGHPTQSCGTCTFGRTVELTDISFPSLPWLVLINEFTLTNNQ